MEIKKSEPFSLSSSLSTKQLSTIPPSSVAFQVPSILPFDTPDDSKPNSLTEILHCCDTSNYSLPLDYSLANFKQALTVDFPINCLRQIQPSLQAPNANNACSTVTTTMPVSSRFLQHRGQPHFQDDVDNNLQQQYQPTSTLSAFRAVQPNKKIIDSEFILLLKLFSYNSVFIKHSGTNKS